MRVLRMPGTDLVPSVICMGGGPLCVEDGGHTASKLLDTYFELGGNFVDSANVYGKWLSSGKNVCDINIGKWLAATGVRDQMIIASKGGHPPLSEMTSPRLRAGEVSADLNESLEALGSGCIDLYYLHRDDPKIPVDEIIDYLNEFVKDGRIRYFAASNWKPERIAAAQRYAQVSGKQGFSANQVLWNYALPDRSKIADPLIEIMDGSALAYHNESGLAAVAYESQARGFFQKYEATGRVPEGLSAVYGNDANVVRYEKAAAMAKTMGARPSDVALGYVLNRPFAAYAIVGCRTSEQIRDSMGAADIFLTDDQVAELAE